MDEELKRHLEGMEARLVALIAGEVGTLHTQITQAELRLAGRIETMDARQRRDAGLTSTLMELIVKQTRWHEQSDNAVADLAARHSELARKIDEAGGKH